MPYRLSYQAISVGAGHFEKREKREKSSDQARNVELLPGYITGGFRLQLTKIVDCTTDFVFHSISEYYCVSLEASLQVSVPNRCINIVERLELTPLLRERVVNSSVNVPTTPVSSPSPEGGDIILL